MLKTAVWKYTVEYNLPTKLGIKKGFKSFPFFASYSSRSRNGFNHYGYMNSTTAFKNLEAEASALELDAMTTGHD